MIDVLGGVLLAVLAFGCISGLVMAPAACLDLLVKALAALMGLVLLAWLWGWRRPSLRMRVKRLAKAVRAAAESRVPVLSVDWFASGSNLHDSILRVVVASDADRATLREPIFRSEFHRLVAESGFPLLGQAGISLAVDSQETVDRDWGGSWYDYDK